MINFFWIALGGAIGSTLRYLSSSYLKIIFPNFPIGTLFVNIFGSFLIGLLMNYLESKNFSTEFIKYFIIIGILGSFTTFSTFSFDVINLMNNKQFLLSFFYIIISVFSCLLFAYLGYNISKV